MSALNFKEKLNAIRAFVFDIDGVLTDGTITIHSNDTVSRTVFARDAHAIQHAIHQGYLVAIISAARDEMLKTRYLRLGMNEVYLGSTDKEITLKEFAAVYSLEYDNILYLGDDVPDYNAMKLAGIAACPNDAVHEIREISAYVSTYKGGAGCARDVIEQVMRVQNKW
ncbi:MAG TPA: HAD hydrolase family protein [Bacteroidia bacterium]|nr:HAD hydrolase family protein [Bacteroidia bacterium]